MEYVELREEQKYSKKLKEQLNQDLTKSTNYGENVQYRFRTIRYVQNAIGKRTIRVMGYVFSLHLPVL